MPDIALGIDLAAGRGITAIATLAFEPKSSGLPCWLTDISSSAADDVALLACAAEAQRHGRLRVISIDAPLTLPAAVTAALGGALPTPGASPYTRAAERDPFWRTLGIRPLPVSFLGGLTFRALTLLPRLRGLAPDAAIIEVFPSATFAVLRAREQQTGVAPTADTSAQAKRQRKAKTTPASRSDNQALLARWIEGVPASGDGETIQPLGADLLDALAAALTGVGYARGAYHAVGNEAEGQIIVPAEDG